MSGSGIDLSSSQRWVWTVALQGGWHAAATQVGPRGDGIGRRPHGCAVQRTTTPASPVVSVETPSTSGSAQPSTTAGAYVALGDSLAAGYQPGSGDIRETSYPALLAARLKAEGIELELTNLGCSGETSTTLVKGGKCTFDGASQLADAEKALKAAGARAELVTVDIGGNDVLHCARGLTIDQACAEKGLATLKNTLPGAFSQAAGSRRRRDTDSRARLLQPLCGCVHPQLVEPRSRGDSSDL